MRLFVLTLYIFAVAAVGLCAETTEVEYYAIRMDGKKIGHVVESRHVKAGVVATTVDTTMTLARGSVAITVTMLEKSIETTGGKPIGFEIVQNISGMSQKTTGKIVAGEQAKVLTEMMGTKQERTVPFPDGALMTEGVRLLERQKGLKEGTS